MKVSIIRVLLGFMALVGASTAPLCGQVYYEVYTCRLNCDEYAQLTDYVSATSFMLEVSTDSVVQVEELEERIFRIHFKVHDVLFGSYQDSTLSVLYSKSLLVPAMIQGIDRAYGPPFCGNSYDGIRSMSVSEPKAGYFGLMGFRRNGKSIELVLFGPDVQYDFGDEPQLINGEVNHKAIKGVVSTQDNSRRIRRKTLFTDKKELFDFLEKID